MPSNEPWKCWTCKVNETNSDKQNDKDFVKSRNEVEDLRLMDSEAEKQHTGRTDATPAPLHETVASLKL